MVLGGRVVTMDALLTQRPIAQQIVEAGGAYVMGVKENQPQLRADIATVFALPPIRGEIRTVAETVDCGHGRIESRRWLRLTDLQRRRPVRLWRRIRQGSLRMWSVKGAQGTCTREDSW